MARDDLHTAEDLIRVLNTETPQNVLFTPENPDAVRQGLVRTQTQMYYDTARAASRTALPTRTVQQPDFELMYGTTHTARLSQAVQTAARRGRFR